MNIIINNMDFSLIGIGVGFGILFAIIIIVILASTRKPEGESSTKLISITDFLTCDAITNKLTGPEIQYIQDEKKDVLNNIISSYNVTDCSNISDDAINEVVNVGSVTENKYMYNNSIFDKPDDLYCGLFRKQKELSTDTKGLTKTINLGCECVPVKIENGTFDIDTCDYSCNEGYEKWFDANNIKYRTEGILVKDISDNYTKNLPEGQSYCIPKLGLSKPCEIDFDKTKYKQAYHLVDNEGWTSKCYAKSQEDCQDEFNFQASAEATNAGTCVPQKVVLCMPGRTYPEGDPCYTSKTENTYDYSCTLDNCDLTTCETKPPKLGRFASMDACLTAKKKAFESLQSLQKKNDTDTPVTMLVDSKPCNQRLYSTVCGDVEPSKFYITSSDDKGFVGMYVMEGDVKKGCTAEDGFMCSPSIDINDSYNRFQVVNNKLIYRGRDQKPPEGPKICGYNSQSESVFCPSSSGKEINIKLIG